MGAKERYKKIAVYFVGQETAEHSVPKEHRDNAPDAGTMTQTVNPKRKDFTVMQNKKVTIKELAILIFWSIFIGVVGISIALGTLYPPINFIAKPFVCSDGQMTFEKQVNQATPNNTLYSANWFCSKGGSTNLPIDPFPYAGVIYGVVCFPIVIFFKKREDAKNEEERKATEFRPYNNKNKSGLP